MKSTLYIVRHGESKGNLTRTFYGHFDGPLTDIGHRQAKLVSRFFEGKKIDAVYSSDLARAVDTVKPTAESKCLEVIKDKQLREIFAGEWENRNIDELMANYSEEYNIWRLNKSESCCTGGESVAGLQERIFSELTAIAIRHQGQNVIVGTHATPIMVMVPSMLGESLETINGKHYVPNASITTVTYEDGKWEIIKYGQADHLGEIVTTMSKGF